VSGGDRERLALNLMPKNAGRAAGVEIWRNDQNSTGAAFAALPISAFPADNPDLQSVLSQIAKMHDENVKPLQDRIALPSIAAENRNYPQGPDYMAQLARDAGFANVEIVPKSGKPGVFGTLDTGAPARLLGFGTMVWFLIGLYRHALRKIGNWTSSVTGAATLACTLGFGNPGPQLVRLQSADPR
jgi:hypothetical protein